MKLKTACMALLFMLHITAIYTRANTTLVGGSTLNGDFNANPGDNVSFADTDFWFNLSGDQSVSCTRSNLTYDGSQNALMNRGKILALDTGYTISEGDVFDLSYMWRDAWDWVDASDQISVSLFITDDDSLTGIPTELVEDLSGFSTQNNTYELVDHDLIYAATSAVTGKTLFVSIFTDSPGFARLDNVQLLRQGSLVYYLSASGNNTNDGLTPGTAWRDVDALDGRTFLPGVSILFNRGDTFPGATTLLGSGASNKVITVGAYGTGNKPLLTGAANSEAIFLLNSGNEYIEFNNLHLSNFNTNNASIPEREVIMVDAPANAGEMNHLYFRNLDVFNVQGYGRALHEDDHRSYAIWLQTAGNDAYADRFNDVLCENCTFSNLDGRAFSINDGSQSYADWRNSGTPYFPSVNCVFQNNYGTNIYRNMAMSSGTDGFLLQYNTMDTTVEGSAYWPFNCANTLVQYNVFKNLFADDADAYACHYDYNCTNTVMQYNYGYNIQGGLIEIIVNSKWAGMFQENAIARYNIGVDVGWRGVADSPGVSKPNGTAIYLTGRVTGSKVHNNTIVQLNKPQYQAISFNNWGGDWPTNNMIMNNIFYAADTAVTYNNIGKGNTLNNVVDNNLYYGNISPPYVDQNPLTVDPVFAGASKFLTEPESITPQDLKVLFGSGAVASGNVVADNGGVDFFGNAVSASTAATLGAHEYQSDAQIDSDGDKMPDMWESTYSLNPGSTNDALAHSDSDTLVNLAEFALGGDPTDGKNTGYPVQWEQSGAEMVYVYPQRTGSTLIYQLETSTNLVSNVWTNSGYVELPETGIINADFESVTNRVPPTEDSAYVRLKVQ